MRRFGGQGSCVVLSVVASLFLTGSLYAGPVDPAQAQRVTDAFLKAKTVAARPGAVSAQGFAVGAQLAPGGLREIRSDDGTLLAYVANLEPRGFIALAADTDVAPVIAYSFRCSFPDDADPKNPLYRMVCEDLRLRAKALAERPELKTTQTGKQWDLYAAGQIGAAGDGVFQQWPPVGSTSTGGWLETAWEQGEPYNQFCPRDTVDGGRSAVGCVATALAQVLNYHRLCNVVFGPNDAYTVSTGMRMDADSALYDFPSFAALNDYVQSVQSAYDAGVELNDTEAAILSFAAGVAVRMDYTSEGSGSAGDVATALRKKFGFYSADMFGALSAESYLVLQENMINRLPALMSIVTPDIHYGHMIVCDGYNTDGEYHLNFGYGTSMMESITEAWYRLPTGIYPLDWVVTETTMNIRPSAPALQTDPASLNFYGVPGQESESQLLRIQANVDGLQVTSIASPEGFVIARADEFSDHLTALPVLQARQKMSIMVQFRPTRAGGYYGTLTIHYNDDSVRYVILRGWSFEGGTAVPAGDVSGIWSLDKSPYFVNGAIQVPQDGSLSLEPGVKVFFTGPYGLTAGKNAQFTAQGTAVAPIELTAWNREVGWGGLRFIDSGSDDALSYCNLTWAKKTAGIVPAAGSEAADTDNADTYGGAIYCSETALTVENCRLTNNVGDGGGAIYCEGSSLVIRDTLIANNASAGGLPRCGGICVYDPGRPVLRNCTIVNNSPGGVFAASWDGLTVTNTIVWGNEMYQIETLWSSPVVTFCDVQGGYLGQGNRSADPAFFSPSAGPGIEYDGLAANWGLQSSSPCINAGTDVSGLPATDLVGAARKASGVLDLGAYENQSDLPLLTITPSVTANAGFVQLNASGTAQCSIANTGQQDFTVQSVSITDGGKAFSLVTPISNQVIAPGGSIPVKVAFNPVREADYKGKLEVRSTASNGARVQVALSGVGISGTVVAPGAVSGTWKKSASPYVVTGNITVGRNKTLTIEPGVTVKFAGRFGLTVGYRGTLKAIGTAQDRIVFTATDTREGWYGIRLINCASDETLQFCTLEYADKPRTEGGGVPNVYGGAILCYASWDDDPYLPMPTNLTVDSCLLAYNSAFAGGAIACCDGYEAIEATITHNTIIDNAADYYGAGIALYGCGATIANNLIVRNSSNYDGGGIKNVGSGPSIVNNTFVANRPSALFLESAGMDFDGNVLPATVINNIIWKNEIQVSEDAAPGDFDIRYNDIQGGWDGEGNIDKDPAFANADVGDYHLRSQTGRWDPFSQAWVVDAVTSPCIDAGDPTSDVGQEPTPNGQRIDMGAYGGTEQASKSTGL